MASKQGKSLKPMQATIAGGLSGVLTRFVISPLDVVKIRLQLQLEPIGNAQLAQGGIYYTGWRDALAKIYKHEGVTGLFKGNLAADLLYLAFGAVQFGCYNEWKKATGPITPWKSMIGGGFSGAMATFCTYPMDILRTRLAAQGDPKLYHSLAQAIRHMYVHEGITAYYRGLWPSLVQIVPYMSLQFTFYESFKHIARQARALAANEPIDTVTLPSRDSLMSGAAAGCMSKFLVLPLDCIRKRLQVVGFEAARAPFGRTEQYTGMADCTRSIWRNEGAAGFFKGGVPAILKALVSSAVTFASYEKISDLFRIYGN